MCCNKCHQGVFLSRLREKIRCKAKSLGNVDIILHLIPPFKAAFLQLSIVNDAVAGYTKMRHLGQWGDRKDDRVAIPHHRSANPGPVNAMTLACRFSAALIGLISAATCCWQRDEATIGQDQHLGQWLEQHSLREPRAPAWGC